MADVNNEYFYVAECPEQFANIVNFPKMINAVRRLVGEIYYSLSSRAQMPENVVRERPCICDML
jgi:hypothetical protein